MPALVVAIGLTTVLAAIRPLTAGGGGAPASRAARPAAPSKSAADVLSLLKRADVDLSSTAGARPVVIAVCAAVSASCRRAADATSELAAAAERAYRAAGWRRRVVVDDRLVRGLAVRALPTTFVVSATRRSAQRIEGPTTLEALRRALVAASR